MNYFVPLPQIDNDVNPRSNSTLISQLSTLDSQLSTKMALNKNKSHKLYYSIKEVAQMLEVNESLLRYWETEFPHLRPKTTGNNVRQYTEKDIEQIKVIYNLVKVRGFKLAAARKVLNKNRSGAEKSTDILDTLISVRDQLQDLKRHMGGLV